MENIHDNKPQNYEIFLQEIEGPDDYWGPTFRYTGIIDFNLTFNTRFG